MPKTVTIPVDPPILGHDGPIRRVVLREPSFDDYLDLGDISTVARADGGTLFSMENSEVLRAYMGRCVVEPKDPLLLAQGGLQLARKLKAAVVGFFQSGAEGSEDSPTSPTSSSSGAATDGSTPATSAG